MYFLKKQKKSAPNPKYLNIKSTVLRYLGWIGFDYNEASVLEPEIADTEIPVELPLVAAGAPVEEEAPNVVEVTAAFNPEETILSKEIKQHVMIGKGFVILDHQHQQIVLTKEYSKAGEVDDDQAQIVIDEFGGKKVTVETRHVLIEEVGE